ncbi:hypothetical protein GOP47_0024250 [Adiantum capillus-veneris]|uniref:Uncharacterized protein n=1 Tax=Adiantum capillus-veneris TaxID=13818 RepID=A0A9D4U5J5_ADICA|nr:hypothetical protein GOP47_0024250 [Adiantum capillus-veneris]
MGTLGPVRLALMMVGERSCGVWLLLDGGGEFSWWQSVPSPVAAQSRSMMFLYLSVAPCKACHCFVLCILGWRVPCKSHRGPLSSQRTFINFFWAMAQGEHGADVVV